MNKYRLSDLKKTLLSYGGNKVVFNRTEEDLYDIIDKGQLWGNNKYLIKMEMCQCHKNSIFYWDKNRKDSFFVTGYALANNGIWYQHSWILNKHNDVIDTTADRIKYFGFILTNLESEIFLSTYNKETINVESL